MIMKFCITYADMVYELSEYNLQQLPNSFTRNNRLPFLYTCDLKLFSDIISMIRTYYF